MEKLAHRVPRKCPKNFHDRLTQIGGKNRHGGPNFLLVWAQDSFQLYAGLDKKYHRMPTDFGEPCWVLKQWHGAEEYGNAVAWYMENYDAATGLSMLGPFPYKGKYETVLQFKFKKVQGNKLDIKYVPLTSDIITMMVPLIRRAKSHTALTKKAAIQEAHDYKDKQQTQRIADTIQDARPAYLGPVSYGRQKDTASVLQKRMSQIEKDWNQLLARADYMRSKGSFTA